MYVCGVATLSHRRRNTSIARLISLPTTDMCKRRFTGEYYRHALAFVVWYGKLIVEFNVPLDTVLGHFGDGGP